MGRQCQGATARRPHAVRPQYHLSARPLRQAAGANRRGPHGPHHARGAVSGCLTAADRRRLSSLCRPAGSADRCPGSGRQVRRQEQSLGVLLNLPLVETARLEPQGALRTQFPPPPPAEDLTALALRCRPDRCRRSAGSSRHGRGAAHPAVRHRLARCSGATRMGVGTSIEASEPPVLRDPVTATWQLGRARRCAPVPRARRRRSHRGS
jgi:hypothetical protein